jgi:hypothetical protein
MSARAAWRLDALGFQQLYRYQAGKADWLAAQLALEGAKADTRTAADVARRDVPACTLGARVSEVAEQVRDRGWPLGVVLNERRIVLGRLRPRDLAARPDALAEEIMKRGTTNDPRNARSLRDGALAGRAPRARRPRHHGRRRADRVRETGRALGARSRLCGAEAPRGRFGRGWRSGRSSSRRETLSDDSYVGTKGGHREPEG